jgi:hypothetical protein
MGTLEFLGASQSAARDISPRDRPQRGGPRHHQVRRPDGAGERKKPAHPCGWRACCRSIDTTFPSCPLAFIVTSAAPVLVQTQRVDSQRQKSKTQGFASTTGGEPPAVSRSEERNTAGVRHTQIVCLPPAPPHRSEERREGAGGRHTTPTTPLGAVGEGRPPRVCLRSPLLSGARCNPPRPPWGAGGHRRGPYPSRVASAP